VGGRNAKLKPVDCQKLGTKRGSQRRVDWGGSILKEAGMGWGVDKKIPQKQREQGVLVEIKKSSEKRGGPSLGTVG